MSAITNYATLTTAINEWSDRSYASTRTDQFIALAESEFNNTLRNYRREITDTITTDADGEATLPTDFRRMRSIRRDIAGAAPLEPVGWRALAALNPQAIAAEPVYYAISGSTLKVAPIAEDDFVLTYDAALTALSGSNATNWLITLAPLAYLFMCLSMAEAYEKNFNEAAVWKQQAMEQLETIGILSDLAQYGSGDMSLDFVTP